jgi:RimJ/RimL family protein N-acetyltransferase
MGAMILETDRLKLRPFQSDDVEAIAAYSTQPEFIRFMPLPPQTIKSAAEFVGRIVADGQPDAKNDWHFAIQLGGAPRLISTIRQRSISANPLRRPAHPSASAVSTAPGFRSITVR